MAQTGHYSGDLNWRE